MWEEERRGQWVGNMRQSDMFIICPCLKLIPLHHEYAVEMFYLDPHKI